jgi:RNA polymerase sigma factor (sigma-70 family)
VTAFAVFLLSFFIGIRRIAVSGVGCRSPPFQSVFLHFQKFRLEENAVKYAPRKVYIKESGSYVELSYKDFCCRRQADQSYMDKLFIPIQGCLIEVVREQYADFYKDKERWRYLKKLDTNHNLLSLEGFTDSEGNVIDFVVDEAVDVAEAVVHAAMVDWLKAALPLLPGSEQALIQAIFFEELSEREVGLRLGVTQSVVNKRKAKILAKLRKIIENKI